MKAPAAPEWYRTAEVAALYRVDHKTVSRWANQGRFPEGTAIRTPGGDWRFRADYIRAATNGGDAA